MALQPPMEHDYIGLAEALPSTMGTSHNLDDLKGTELRLGLPGSGSPERKDRPVLTLGLTKSCYGSGAKRVFSDAIDKSGKWVFPGGKGCEGEMGKGGALFSPRRENVKEEGPKIKGNGGRNGTGITPAAKAQVVGWPPIRSYRKNSMAANPSKNNDNTEDKNGSGSLFVKVSMDGAPYLRKVDLRTLSNYKELSMALEKMFSCFTIGQCGSYGLPSKDGLSENRLTDMLHGSEHVLTYEDKDGDWMLVGDVPWDMFTETCRRLRIMKGSEAIGLAPRAADKGKTRK